MTSENAKTRSNFFSKDEIMISVYSIFAEKSILFGALRTTLTFDDKNKVREDIVRTKNCSLNHTGNSQRALENSTKHNNMMYKYCID